MGQFFHEFLSEVAVLLVSCSAGIQLTRTKDKIKDDTLPIILWGGAGRKWFSSAKYLQGLS
jgi:hypothetical protein